jgi:nucleoside-diphosphate-sugar epimerase
MNILITGGAGYIGSILTPHLLAAKHRVTVIDNFMYQQQALLDCCYHTNLEIIRGDARDERLLKSHLATSDVIIPLACLVGAPACAAKPFDAQSINLDAVTTLATLSSSDQMIISPTTNSGYGVGETGILCTEESPLRPISLYGSLKVELEARLLATGHAVSLRLATACGISPRMRLDLLVNDFTYRAVTEGVIVLFESHFKRNFIHVRDIARAFVHAIENFDSMSGDAYNVGLSDANLSKHELCMEIKKQIPQFTIMEAEHAKDPDQRNYIVSNAKIEQTGYKPIVSIQDAIKELIKGYQVIRRHTFTNL